MPSYVTPKKGVEFIFYISLVSQSSTKTMQSNPTIASGDFKVSIDGGALANPATLPAVTPASSKMVKVTLSTSEMNGDNVTLICSDASGAEWCDLVVNIQTSARQIDDLAYPATSGRSTAIDASGQVTVGAIAANAITTAAINDGALTAAKIADGAIDAATFAAGAINAAAIASDAITDAKVASDVTIASVTGAVGSVTAGVTLANNSVTAAAVAADAVTEIQSGLATATNLATLQTSVDDLPTNAELATSQAAADDATLAAIAALNNLSAAQVNTEVDTALADYDAPTKAELDSAVATLATAANLATVAGYLDTEIAAILVAVDTEIATLVSGVAAILADTGTDGVVLSTATQQAIADVLLGRSAANVESSAGIYTIAGLIFAAFESAVSGVTWTINRSDGTTQFATRTVATDVAAEPIVSVQ